MSTTPPKFELSTSTYSGRCPTCGNGYRGEWKSVIGLVPPPVINVCCGCEIPVTEVPMVYQGPVMAPDIERKEKKNS